MVKTSANIENFQSSFLVRKSNKKTSISYEMCFYNISWNLIIPVVRSAFFACQTSEFI